MIDRKLLLRRSKAVLAAAAALMILFSYFIVRESVIVRGFDVETDELKENTVDNAMRNSVIEGSIYDSEGAVITSADRPGTSGRCEYPSFSYLVGYNNSDSRFGLRGRYRRQLHTGVVGERGACMKLTVRADIQDKAASLLSAEGLSGSVIVLDVASGRIAALASRRGVDFNVNELGEKYALYSEQKDFFIAPGYRDPDPPGSTFKMITAAAMIENGMEDRTYNDTGTAVFDGTGLHNAGMASYGEIGLREALSKSVNTYFAQMAVELGPDRLEDTARAFMIGEDIELDVTTLRSNFDLGSGSDLLVATTGFGQGRLLMTPLHIAMCAQSIANGGVMLRPYLIDSVSLGDKELMSGKSASLGRTVSRGTAGKLRDLLHSAAVSYGYDEETYGYICAKTGTAQLGDGTDHIYLAAFSDRYVVMCSANGTVGRYGSSLRKMSFDMLRYLDSHPYYYRNR